MKATSPGHDLRLEQPLLRYPRVRFIAKHGDQVEATGGDMEDQAEAEQHPCKGHLRAAENILQGCGEAP